MLFTKDTAVKSLLEVDAYKFTMGAFIWRFFPNLRVRFAFRNRTQVPLARFVDPHALQQELEAIRAYRIGDNDIAYLRSWGIFPEGYLQALKELRLPELLIEERDGQLRIEAQGRWLEVTFWETIVLATVAERYAQARAKQEGIGAKGLLEAAEKRLAEKIKLLQAGPKMPILQFGLRRRLSGAWERLATERMYEEGTPFAGVSNVALARELGVEALGTNAHELPMALAALARHESDREVRQAPYRVLELWERLYGQKLLVMLPDAFGSRRFFEELPQEYAKSFRGVRQDSGDPFAFGEMLLGFYRKRGIDPKEKMIIFSDGLTVPKMQELYRRFAGEFGTVSFGWGTNFTNDTGLIKPLSLVMKLVEAAGNPAVKLSDNLEKAVGDSEEVAAYKRIFGYAETFREKPIY